MTSERAWSSARIKCGDTDDLFAFETNGGVAKADVTSRITQSKCLIRIQHIHRVVAGLTGGIPPL